MKTLIVASNNDHKIKEIKEFLKDFQLEILGLKEAGIHIDIDETGKTFMENSKIKAKEIFKIAKDSMVLADDSGLSVDSLNGEPGVFSARYSGDHGNDIENNKKLIRKLKGIPYEDRKARFICAMTLIVNEETSIEVQGEVEGFILEEYTIREAFGYDPLFYVPELKATFADVPLEVKNSISHRGRALEKLKSQLKNHI